MKEIKKKKRHRNPSKDRSDSRSTTLRGGLPRRSRLGPQDVNVSDTVGSGFSRENARIVHENNIGNAAAPPPPPHDYRTGERDGTGGGEGRYRFTTFSRAHERQALSGFPDGGDDGTRRRRTRHFRLKRVKCAFDAMETDGKQRL